MISIPSLVCFSFQKGVWQAAVPAITFVAQRVFSSCVSFHPWPLWIPLTPADARVSRAPAAAGPSECFPSHAWRLS